MDKRQISHFRTKRLVTSAILIAASTVLSLVKLMEMPYGGSITLLSMLPILIAGFQYGVKWGLLVGFTDGLLQLLIGMSAFRGISAMAVVAAVFLDFLLAFGVLGLAGLYNK